MDQESSVLDGSVRSNYFANQYTRNRLYRDLEKGLEALRGGVLFSSNEVTPKSMYLPQFEKEPDHIYKNRLNRSYLVNYWKRSIQSDVGKVVSSSVQVKSNNEYPEEYIEQWLDNTDLEGKTIDVLAKDQLYKAMSKALTLCFVDFVSDTETPFVHEIDIDDVLDFKTDRRTGKLIYLSWSSTIISDSEDSLGSQTKNARWELEPNEWRLYLEDDTGMMSEPSEQGEILRYKEDGRTLITDEIPVSVIYTNKKGTLLGESPYATLAELTIEHFQVSSDVKNNLFYALTPMLFGKGLPEELNITAMAAWQMIKLDDSDPEAVKNAEIRWVQASAEPIKEAREQLKDIEYRISSFGVDAANIRPSGNQTATQTAINSAGSSAALKGFSAAISQHIERIVKLMHSYLNYPCPDLEVEITADFDISDNNDKAKTAIEAYEKGLISAKAATDILIQNNVLSKNFDFDEDQAEKALQIINDASSKNNEADKSGEQEEIKDDIITQEESDSKQDSLSPENS